MKTNTSMTDRISDIEENWFGESCHADMQYLIKLVRFQRMVLSCVQGVGNRPLPKHITALVNTAIKGTATESKPVAPYAEEPEITLVFPVPNPEEM